MSRITPRGSDVTGRFGEKYHSRLGMIHSQTDRPRNHVLCVAKWYGAKYALGAEGILNSCVFSFSSLAATQAGYVRERRRRSAHFEPVTFFNCFIIYGRGGTLVIDPSLPGPIPLPPPSLPLSLSFPTRRFTAEKKNLDLAVNPQNVSGGGHGGGVDRCSCLRSVRASGRWKFGGKLVVHYYS